jgi:hypothetical protein
MYLCAGDGDSMLRARASPTAGARHGCVTCLRLLQTVVNVNSHRHSSSIVSGSQRTVSALEAEYNPATLVSVAGSMLTHVADPRMQGTHKLFQDTSRCISRLQTQQPPTPNGSALHRIASALRTKLIQRSPSRGTPGIGFPRRRSLMVGVTSHLVLPSWTASLASV